MVIAAETLDTLKQKAIAHLRLKGAMESIGLARAIGESYGTGKPSYAFEKTLAFMQSEGLITVSQGDRFSPRTVRLAEAAKSIPPRSEKWNRGQCRVIIDDRLKGAWQPQKPEPRSETGDRSLEELQKELDREAKKLGQRQDLEVGGLRHFKRKAKTTACDAVEKLNKALDELIAIGEPFRNTDVPNRAGLPEMTLYNHKAIHERTKEAIKSIEQVTGRKALRSKPVGSGRKSDGESANRLNNALDDLIGRGKPFTIVEVCRRAGVSDTAIYFHPDIQERAKRAIESIPILTPEERDKKLLAALQELIAIGNPFTQKDVAQKAEVPISFLKRTSKIKSLINEAIKIANDRFEAQTQISALKKQLETLEAEHTELVAKLDRISNNQSNENRRVA